MGAPLNADISCIYVGQNMNDRLVDLQTYEWRISLVVMIAVDITCWRSNYYGGNHHDCDATLICVVLLYFGCFSLYSVLLKFFFICRCSLALCEVVAYSPSIQKL